MKLPWVGLFLLRHAQDSGIRLLRLESNLEKRISAMSLGTRKWFTAGHGAWQTLRSWAQQPRLARPAILRCWKIQRKSRLCSTKLPNDFRASEQAAPSYMGSKFITRVCVEDTCVLQRARVHRAGCGLWPSSLPGRYLPAG